MRNQPFALGLDIPNFLPDRIFGLHLDWVHPAGRLIWATLIAVVATIVIVVWAKTPKRPEPVTWAGAMAAAIGVFALMILGYGVLPHEWLTFANSYLNWGRDTFVLQQNSIVPFDVPKSAVTDSIAALIYVVVATVNVALFVMWQKRPVREAEAEEAPSRSETGTSAYGRPVTASN